MGSWSIFCTQQVCGSLSNSVKHASVDLLVQILLRVSEQRLLYFHLVCGELLWPRASWRSRHGPPSQNATPGLCCQLRRTSIDPDSLVCHQVTKTSATNCLSTLNNAIGSFILRVQQWHWKTDVTESKCSFCYYILVLYFLTSTLRLIVSGERKSQLVQKFLSWNPILWFHEPAEVIQTTK